MANVHKRRKIKPPAGYSGNRGAQESTEDKAARKFDEMLRRGKKKFEYKGILYVVCGGKFVEWSRAEARLIGRLI